MQLDWKTIGLVSASHDTKHTWKIWNQYVKNCLSYCVTLKVLTDGQTGGQMDGRTDGLTDWQTEKVITIVLLHFQCRALTSIFIIRRFLSPNGMHDRQLENVNKYLAAWPNHSGTNTSQWLYYYGIVSIVRNAVKVSHRN